MPSHLKAKRIDNEEEADLRWNLSWSPWFIRVNGLPYADYRDVLHVIYRVPLHH